MIASVRSSTVTPSRQPHRATGLAFFPKLILFLVCSMGI